MDDDVRLSAEAVEALTYWPRIVHAVRPAPVSLSVLLPLFSGWLCALPWWDREWRVTALEPAYPHETRRDGSLGPTEVGMRGTVSRAGEELAAWFRIGFHGDRLIRFEAKVGETVIASGTSAAGEFEPHPFGRVFSGLMDARGISKLAMAKQVGLAMSTIAMLAAGARPPRRRHVEPIADALGLSVVDLMIIAGVED